jgi:hypothetical protein
MWGARREVFVKNENNSAYQWLSNTLVMQFGGGPLLRTEKCGTMKGMMGFGSRFRQHWLIFEKLGHLNKSASNVLGVHPTVTSKTFRVKLPKNKNTTFRPIPSSAK